MPVSLSSVWLLAAMLLSPPAPSRVTIGLGALHAAALTTSRGPADSSDAPYLLVSTVGSRTSESAHLPATGHWRLLQNGIAPTTTQVAALELAPGDSVRVVISVLESDAADQPGELGAATATTRGIGRLAHPLLDPADGVLQPVLDRLGLAGAHWIGSVSLLVTNESGTTWWRRMECAHSCAVVKGLPAGGATLGGASGVYELTGSGGTFHLQLGLQQGE